MLKTTTGVVLTLLLATPMFAKSFLSQDEALKLAFPGSTAIERESIFLSADERGKARELSGVAFDDELVVRYVGRKGDEVLGYAYFDAHRVRTLPEAIMILVRPDGSVGTIEILSFNEPQEYLPRERWLDQLDGHSLDDELSLTRAIRPITGATLSGRAIVNATRKMLAIHQVVMSRGEKK